MNILLLIIIASNVIISFKGFNDAAFLNKYKFQVGPIRKGESFRMFSSGFLHADPMHLAFNMIALYSLGEFVLSNWGDLPFLILYVGSLLAGSLLSLVIYKDQPWYSAVGASGAVTGIIYAAILTDPNLKLYLFMALPIPAYLFGILYLLYSLYGVHKQSDSIGHGAHFGGAIAGLVLPLLMRPSLFIERFPLIILLLLPIAFLFYQLKQNKL
ncbi:MAG: rhomboid family intramembrane serine protease [Flavobacterium sp. BFFFF2]|nr:MAG: rhomboid family intramembrane serine protease [Flavobacterium sp. BFFFF2]